MLPLSQQVAFLAFAAIMIALACRGFYRLYRRISAGRKDSDARINAPLKRLWYSLVTTITQRRTFRKRPWVSFFHSFIFYGFVFYMFVNLLDAIDGFVPLSPQSLGLAGQLYVFFADILSVLVLVGVVSLVLRRFLLPSRKDFSFNERTLLHPDIKQKYIVRDSLIVSAFILFHVGSRVLGSGAKIALEGPDRFAPFATAVSHLFTPQNAAGWRIFGYWGALGSVLAFLAYFPYTKHIHIFMASTKYFVARDVSSGVLPALTLDLEEEEPKLGASKLEDLAWPRLLDAYACIQCNRCQDVCPATATGKALSPSALEINKRMELNDLALHQPSFEAGAPSPRPLLSFALSLEAAWACTTCGACIQVCPVQDEPMLDIIDVRRQQVMMEGEFPAQLQTAFRGMERAQNPWGVNHAKRMDWAEGLDVPTTEQNPEPEVLYWVGCAASYDPQSQKTARATVQLLQHAGVDFAVLGKNECCTGDSARRAGNEYLYRQLADKNVSTLNELKPKLIVASCPHCMNAIGQEYRQIGGDYKVMHHSEYLASLLDSGRLVADSSSSTIAFHDPCYLGRHNDVYDAPRNVLKVLSNSVVELPRNRENSFCCGAGGAQFWKEEEPGNGRISETRHAEAQQTLGGARDAVLAVGCPFCKSMLDSVPHKGDAPLPIKDLAELLLEGVQRRLGTIPAGLSIPSLSSVGSSAVSEVVSSSPNSSSVAVSLESHSAVSESLETDTVRDSISAEPADQKPRSKWVPKGASPRADAAASASEKNSPNPAEISLSPFAEEPPRAPVISHLSRRKWMGKAEFPKQGPEPLAAEESLCANETAVDEPADGENDRPKRKTWKPKN